MKETTQILQSKAKKVYSKDLIELLFSYPYTKIDFLEKKLKIHRHTASTYLKTCESVSLLQSIKIGRNKYFVNTKLFDILRKELLWHTEIFLLFPYILLICRIFFIFSTYQKNMSKNL